MSRPSHKETKPLKQQLPNERFIAESSPEGRRKTCGQQLGPGPGRAKVQLASNPVLCPIPPFCPAPQKLFTDSGLLREEISKVETNEEVAPSPEANQSIEGREDGPKGEKKTQKMERNPMTWQKLPNRLKGQA